MNKKKMTLEEAYLRIDDLERECNELKSKLEKYENRLPIGRRKHDAKWQESYDYFVSLYSEGRKISEIIEMANFSQRTAYRYKEFYDKNQKEKE